MAKKSSTQFVCENCGNKLSRWIGKCPVCSEWNTYVEEKIVSLERSAIRGIGGGDNKVISISEVKVNDLERIKTPFVELDRVLGGGLVHSEVILIGGEPGIGKSTFLLQVLSTMQKDYECLYVSGEESSNQVALRAKRLFPGDKDYGNLKFIGSSNLTFIFESIEEVNPQIVVIDSIQTVFDEDSAGLPGSIAQVRACSTKLTSFAKSKGFILIIVGHINKEGEIAGPKVLEHIVDCVMQLEGSNELDYRILRSVKNRFGPTGEVGIFVMSEKGLNDLNIDKNIFNVSESEKEIGVAKSVVVEGNRPIILDIQALVNNTVFPYPKRVAEGLSISRLQLISAILGSSKLSNLNTKDIYLRVSGGYVVRNNPYSDLAIAAALLSANKNKALSSKYVFIGEVGLNGRVLVSSRLTNVLKEIERYKDSFIVVTGKTSVSNSKKSSSIQISHISELINLLG